MRFFKRQESGAAQTADAAPAAQTPDADGCIGYALLLDEQKRVVGYRLRWHPASPQQAGDAVSRFKAMVGCAGRYLHPPKTGWQLGRTLLFLDVTAESLAAAELQLLPPENVVLSVELPVLLDEELRPIVLFLREQGFGFMLRGAEALPEAPELRGLLTHFDVGTGETERVKQLRREAGPLPRLVATRAEGWPAFEACAAQHVEVFVDGAALQPLVEDGAGDRRLQPESMLIVRLMQMIQRNEDLREIEAALKRDAALTYRLLRYINSPAIGAGVEIHSLRHAVTMLGYAPLFRWLSVLLASSNAKAGAPFMMKKAIVRGRFVELMGQGMLPAGESDNLFVAGMFSLIDRLLGVSMQEVLGKVQLSEAVQQAILRREGVYGPFLALAEACEEDGARAAGLAESLFLSAEQVNAAHLSAIVWAQDVAPGEAAY